MCEDLLENYLLVINVNDYSLISCTVTVGWTVEVINLVEFRCKTKSTFVSRL